MSSLTVFLDSSVVLAGLASVTGGSRKLFQAGKVGAITLVVSEYVIEEVTRHLSKLGLTRADLDGILENRTVRVVKGPSQAIVGRFLSIVTDSGDAPILAGAVLSGADTLISLDKKHVLTPKIKKALRPIRVFNPKQFWQWFGKHVVR